MTELKFRYPRRHYIVRSINLLAILVVFFAFTVTLSGLGWFWPSLFFIIFLVTIIITSLSPIFTAHGVDDNGVTIRQGLNFRARFLFHELESVEKMAAPMWKFGIPVSRSRRRINIATTNHGLVLIRLKEKKTFTSLLLRSGNELVIDLTTPERFVEMVDDKLNRHRAVSGIMDKF